MNHQRNMAGLPRPTTPEGQAGLDAMVSAPGSALIASDYDGTLSPIVSDPAAARGLPSAIAALRRLAPCIGTLAVITGRPVAEAVELGDLASVPGLIVLGHYGRERWVNGQVTASPAPPGVATVRRELPGVLRAADAPDGVRIEDKGDALAVHTRGTADPDAAQARLRSPLQALAERTGLMLEPGRRVIELRPPGTDKGLALTDLTAERGARSVLFCGDDLGDLPAFAAVRALRSDGTPGLAVVSAAPESEVPPSEADVLVDGPPGIATFLHALADAVAKP